MYRPIGRRAFPGRWSAGQAQRWLSFLAHHLEFRVRSTEFAWWQLESALPPFIAALTVGVAGGLTFGLLGVLLSGWHTTLAVIMPAATASGIGYWLLMEPLMVGSTIRPQGAASDDLPTGVLDVRTSATAVSIALLTGTAYYVAAWPLTFPWTASGGGAIVGFLAGMRVVLLFNDRLGTFRAARNPDAGIRLFVPVTVIRPRRGLRWRRPRRGVLLVIAGVTTGVMLVAGPLAGLQVLLAAALAGGLRGIPWDLRTAPSPRKVLAGDRRGSGFFLVCFLLVFGLCLAVGAAAPAWLAVGLAIGIVVTGDQSLWPWWTIVRIWLVLCRRLPGRTMLFLEDARSKGILRQSGAHYQFCHVELQRRLAEHYRG